MKKNEIQALALKISQVFFFMLGIVFTSYNLFSFKVDKYGYFFVDSNQGWLTFGIAMIATGYFIRNWNKL